MKKPSAIQRFKQLPKRTRNITIAAVAGVLFTCCCLIPLAFSDSAKDETKIGSINTVSLPTDTMIAPTVTFTVASTSTIAPTNTVEPTFTQPSKLNACLADNAKIETAKVTKIVDGDTIDVVIAGNLFTVRYIGMDTPETVAPNNPVEFYGPEAAQRNSDLVSGKEIILVKDVSETDRYDRLLRYVFIGGVFVNETLVKEGYARANTYPPDTACQSVLSSAQEVAKAQTIGIWSTPSKTVEIATLTPAVTSGGCPQGCTEEKPGCSIKGNINSDGEKIYHVPGSSSYSRTKIDPSNGERWFCTAAEAEANGWRAPRN